MFTDRDLLFGEIALRLSILDGPRLAAATREVNELKDENKVSLGEVLLRRGWIGEADKTKIERMVEDTLREQGYTTLQDALPAPTAELGTGHTTMKQEPDLNPDVNPDVNNDDLTETLSLTDSGYHRIQEITPLDRVRSHYSLDRVHAVGGLGRVFVARDDTLNREVALKEIRPEHADQNEVRSRFLREAQITGQLEHPNIVPVYELVECGDGESPFYTMRFVRGETLRQAIRAHHDQKLKGEDGRLGRHRLLQAFLDVCNAVAYAHSRGVIHRDLKPENILLGSFGEVILLDWGLAKMIDEPETAGVELSSSADVQQTRHGNLLGTPAYMAPEQAAGKLHEVDQKTDIYGLGAILFEILTGRAPHTGNETKQVIETVIDRPTPRAIDVHPSVPRPLNAICAMAMAKNREDRYQSAEALVDDVRRYLGDEEICARPDTPLRRLGRWGRHHRAWAMAAFLTLVAAVLVTSVTGYFMMRSATQTEEALAMTNHLREDSARVTSWFAAKAMAGEIDQRWRILEGRAEDSRLREWMTALRDPNRPQDPDQLRDWLLMHPNFERMNAWIKRRHQECTKTTKASNWSIFDSQGVQVARHPFVQRTIGRNFSFRDYFHGRGRDLPPEQGSPDRHISDAHLSVVIVSQSSGHRMVLFSVPIWSSSQDEKNATFLGVLSMSVELGHFRELQIGLTDNQIAVLADTREDTIEGEPKTGLLLHHPQLALLREQGAKKLPSYRLTPETVNQLRELRKNRMKQSEELSHRPWKEQLTIREKPLEGSLVRGYVSHVPGKYSGEWIAAFEPVLIEGRPDPIKDTGWVIIIQERKGESLAR